MWSKRDASQGSRAPRRSAGRDQGGELAGAATTSSWGEAAPPTPGRINGLGNVVHANGETHCPYYCGISSRAFAAGLDSPQHIGRLKSLDTSNYLSCKCNRRTYAPVVGAV